MRVRAFCVGGTIDKIYFDAKSKYEIGRPAITSVLNRLPIHLDVQVSSLMSKDSLEMTDEDRELVAHAVAHCSEDRIIITHGTDTMTDTAAALGDIKDKTVVLTGALQPAIFKDSDAEFNLGAALGAVQALSAGVYIAMNGQIFEAGKVKKDRANNRFMEVEP